MSGAECKGAALHEEASCDIHTIASMAHSSPSLSSPSDGLMADIRLYLQVLKTLEGHPELILQTIQVRQTSVLLVTRSHLV